MSWVKKATSANAAVFGILALIAVVAVGYLLFRLMAARRRADAMAAELRRLKEEMARLEEERKLAQEDEVQKELFTKIAGLRAKIDNYETRIKELDGEREAFNTSLEGVTSWDDLEVSGP